MPNSEENSISIFDHELVIDSAPGKELIKELYDVPSFETLEKFFWIRMDWCGGYPIAHDRLVSYSVFNDLIDKLPSKNRLNLVVDMARLVDKIPDQYFHLALALLAKLIPDDGIYLRPTDFSDIFIRLRLRTEKLSFLPNLTCTWDMLALKQRHLKCENDPLAKYSSKKLEIDSFSWKSYFSYPLPLIELQAAMENCAADIENLNQIILELSDDVCESNLIYYTRIESSYYWVWRLPGKSGTAHMYKLVYLRQPLEGELSLGYWDIYKQFHERDSPEQISTRLLRIEFCLITSTYTVKRKSYVT